jgi:DNA-binding XRE family transcriptional regulator
MAGHRKFGELRGRMSADARARAERGAREDLAEMLLCEIRKLAGLTQEELAAELEIKQPSLSQLESQDDMQISTLRKIVEALGGELEIIAKLPGGRISISQFKGRPDGGRSSAA